jgi:hypothetical protein
MSVVPRAAATSEAGHGGVPLFKWRSSAKRKAKRVTNAGRERVNRRAALGVVLGA